MSEDRPDNSKSDFYCGLTCPPLEVSHFDMGHGVSLSMIYVSIADSMKMLFPSSETGLIDTSFMRPSPIKKSEIFAQLHIPNTFNPPDWPEWFELHKTAWLFVALLRFRITPDIAWQILATQPLLDGKDLGKEFRYSVVEFHYKKLNTTRNIPLMISEDDLIWIKNNWLQIGLLMKKSPEFDFAMQAFDNCVFSMHNQDALLLLWSALEALFGSDKEISFKISTNIAAYLEPPGKKRLELHERVQKLYNERSSTVHGRITKRSNDGKKLTEVLTETHGLLYRILTKMIKDNHVPTHKELKARLFGVDLNSSD